MDDAVNRGSDLEAEIESNSGASKRGVRNQYPDRLKISPEALTRLSSWIAQTNECLRGVKISRSEFVNFLILNHEETLSASELKEMEKKYFDEVKFAQWALEELKLAKSRGEVVSLSDILSNSRSSTTVKSRTSIPKIAKKTKLVDLDG